MIATDEYFAFVCEYAPKGDLLEHIRENGRLKGKDAKRICSQLIAALAYCHQQGVVHRDLKLENVLLDVHGNAKLADWGFGRFFSVDSSSRIKEWCGSPPYAAPEIFLGRPYIGPSIDIWYVPLSLACSLSLALSLARALSRSSLVLWDSLPPSNFQGWLFILCFYRQFRLILIALPAASIIRAVHRSLSCASVCVSVSTKSSRRHLCPPPSSFSLCHVAFLTNHLRVVLKLTPPAFPNLYFFFIHPTIQPHHPKGRWG